MFKVNNKDTRTTPMATSLVVASVLRKPVWLLLWQSVKTTKSYLRLQYTFISPKLTKIYGAIWSNIITVHYSPFCNSSNPFHNKMGIPMVSDVKYSWNVSIHYVTKCHQHFCSLHKFETSFFSVSLLYPPFGVFSLIDNWFSFLFNLYFQQKRAPKLSICHFLIKRSVWVFGVTNRRNGFYDF